MGRLTHVPADLPQRWAALTKERDDLRAEAALWHDECERLAQQRKDLRNEVRELREALKPFAFFADHTSPGGHLIHEEFPATWADGDRAREVLSAGTKTVQSAEFDR